MGASFSNIGNWFNTVAVAVLIYRLTGRVSGVAVALAVSVLPRVVLAPFGGALADRYERRNLLIALDAARAVIALLPLLIHDAGGVWVIYLALLLLQAGSCVYNPTQGAYIPSLVPDDLLESANAAYTTMRDIALFAGPALAWTVLRAWGPSAAFWGNALSFAVSAGVLLTLPRAERGKPIALKGAALIADYMALVRRYPRIAPLYLCYLAYPAQVYFFQAIMVVYVRTLGESTPFIGVLYAAAGLGGILGGVLMGQFMRRLPYAAGMGIYVLCVPLLAALSFVDRAALALVLLALSTLAGTAGDLIFSVTVQRNVAPEERGRAFGLWFWCAPIGQLVGAALGATVAAQMVIPALLVVSSVALPIVLIGALLSVQASRRVQVTSRGAAVESI